MRLLFGMLVVAFLLAAASLAMVREVRAASWTPPELPQPTGCVLPHPVCNCPIWCFFWTENGYQHGHCWQMAHIVDPCFGYEGPCIYGPCWELWW